MSTGSLHAVVGKWEEGFPALSLRRFGIIELQFLVGHWVERRSSERLSSEPEVSAEFLHLWRRLRRVGGTHWLP